MENLKYRLIGEYEYQCCTNAAETARRINNVYGEAQPETLVDNEELKAIVQADPLQTSSKLAAGFGGGQVQTGTFLFCCYRANLFRVRDHCRVDLLLHTWTLVGLPPPPEGKFGHLL
ncbi:hypothetical protein EVAR_96721_1 [Eumeta japonica]|uniref:Uncharacterized protein n=1 Tax=Eumeta variegata TaxID=151549 RepID=A0A4C1WK30_EUMVA|nr:hypothetical protein EVAR_96721_1 [Eumeta japonica]